MSKTFQLGDQPNWANAMPAPPRDGIAFIETLLAETSVDSLIHRGYAIVPLTSTTQSLYTEFLTAFQDFSRRPDAYKTQFASLQFNPAKNSPNQFHGYSEVEGLKTQFMMRLQGNGCKLSFPKELVPSGPRLYEQLDQLCRTLAKSTLRQLGRPDARVDQILDPVNVSLAKSEETGQFGAHEDSSHYLLDGYVSSSIMDNFHYLNKFKVEPAPEQGKPNERYFNNHASHTDSGLMTVVVTTDRPGLEVLDQKLGEWVSLERHMHDYCQKTGKNHRGYACVFWSDSVMYLRNKDEDDSKQGLPLVPCLHRVGKADGERFSVVFKQRTAPTVTAPRYQEDYELAASQLAAQAAVWKKRVAGVLGWIGAAGLAVAAGLTLLRKR